MARHNSADYSFLLRRIIFLSVRNVRYLALTKLLFSSRSRISFGLSFSSFPFNGIIIIWLTRHFSYNPIYSCARYLQNGAVSLKRGTFLSKRKKKGSLSHLFPHWVAHFSQNFSARFFAFSFSPGGNGARLVDSSVRNKREREVERRKFGPALREASFY